MEPAPVALDLVKLISSILWFFLMVAFPLLFYRPIRGELLSNLKVFKAMGMEIFFVKNAIGAAM